jgi:hypothetical protein
VVASGIGFALNWAVNSLWLLGMLLAVDLTFQGVAARAFGQPLILPAELISSFGQIGIAAAMPSPAEDFAEPGRLQAGAVGYAAPNARLAAPAQLRTNRNSLH